MSSGMLRCVTLVRTDVSEELIASIIRMTRMKFLRSMRLFLVTVYVPSLPILVSLMAIQSCETSVLTRVTQRNIPEDGIIHSYRRENLKSYTELTSCTL
jgi:hypothetical protein